MQEKRNWIKFYSEDDLSSVFYLELVASALEHYNADEPICNINTAIEYYNISEYLERGMRLLTWTQNETNSYMSMKKTLMSACANYFCTINDQTFIRTSKDVESIYLEDYWVLIAKFSVYERICDTTFARCLYENVVPLWIILKQSKLVRQYGEIIAKFMMQSDQSARLLSAHFLEATDDDYSIPAALSPSERERILQKYVDSSECNPNILALIMNAQSIKECPISDKLRLSAKHAFRNYCDRHRDNMVSIGYGIGVQFIECEEIQKLEIQENNHFLITYDIKWILQNLDYPTLLNNFRYIFEQFDYFWRSNLVSIRSKISALEEHIGAKGKKDYPAGHVFQWMSMLFSAQTKGYCDVLKDQGILFEEIIQWFFNDYIKNEFGVTGFLINLSKQDASMLDKCRTMASEIDGILKQYRLLAENGEIDRELYELSSEQVVFSMIPSMITPKYAYIGDPEIETEIRLLFSNQSGLTYTAKTGDGNDSFFEMIMKKKMNMDDFSPYQKHRIQWLMDRGTLCEQQDGSIGINKDRVPLLWDMYEHDVLCIRSADDNAEVKKMISRGELIEEGTLFSRPEQEYLNYILNKSQFSNGKDLRNKYIHSTYSMDTAIQERDYVELLKVMVMVVGKINDELCFWDDNKEVKKCPATTLKTS